MSKMLTKRCSGTTIASSPAITTGAQKPIPAAAPSHGIAACHCAGTLITTEAGDVAVERLRLGDAVVTADGGLWPVRWIGWRRVRFDGSAGLSALRPVRIAAGAFGGSLPRRDLLLSPDHAVFLDGALVPVRLLAGCSGITVDTTVQRTTYYALVLPAHDVILAEGLPCESWPETGDRSLFANSAVVTLHFDESHGRARHTDRSGYAPMVTEGPVLDDLRRGLGAMSTQRSTPKSG